ncbi:MAG: acetyltransferase [Proteobacteria bacterium]|nr:acetyltransferase [Pseudomonadota bacterium]
MSLLSKYGFSGIIKLFAVIILTRIEAVFLWKSKVRIIRRPVYIRGQKYISLGNGFTSGVAMRLDAFPIHGKVCIEIGDNVQVNDYVHIGAINSVKIGNNVLIASKVFISDHNHGFYGQEDRHDSPLSIPKDRELSYSSVIIEDNVWLGEFVAVLPGVIIGKGSIIGSMSVVSKSIPPFSIAVGSPAKVIKTYNFDIAKWELI